MVPTVLSRERMIVARRTRRQWKDLNKMDLDIVRMLFLKVTGQVKVRSRKVMINKKGWCACDTCFMGYFPIQSQWWWAFDDSGQNQVSSGQVMVRSTNPLFNEGNTTHILVTSSLKCIGHTYHQQYSAQTATIQTHGRGASKSTRAHFRLFGALLWCTFTSRPGPPDNFETRSVSWLTGIKQCRLCVPFTATALLKRSLRCSAAFSTSTLDTNTKFTVVSNLSLNPRPCRGGGWCNPPWGFS